MPGVASYGIETGAMENGFIFAEIFRLNLFLPGMFSGRPDCSSGRTIVRSFIRGISA